MAGAYSEHQVQLQRDALNTPWGVRLQGGKDFNIPLTVQRVFVGSPADGELHRGDVIVAIQNHDATHILHKQAQDLIKHAGGSMSLRIRRSGVTRAQSVPSFPIAPAAFRSRPQDTFTPKSPTTSGGSMSHGGHMPRVMPQLGGGGPNFGVDYTHGRRGQSHYNTAPRSHHGHHGNMPQHEPQHHYQQQQQQQQEQQPHVHPSHAQVPDSMLNRVNQSLYQAVGSPSAEYEDYEQKSVQDLTKTFTPTPVQRQRPIHHGVVWRKPEAGTTADGIKEFGQVYGNRGNRPVQYQSPAHHAPPAHYAPPPSAPHTSYSPQSYIPKEDYKPSWKGSLKSSGGSKPWEIKEQKSLVGSEEAAPAQHVSPHSPRVQNVHYGPGASSPQYQQQAPEAQDSDTATVQHLQYNSPLGLYSKGNVVDALEGQTHGKPGEGTMTVTGGGPGQKGFDPMKSDVLRMVAEEDEVRKMRGSHGQQQQHAQHQQQQQQQQHYHQQQPHYQQQQQQPSYDSYHGQHGQQDEHVMGTSDF